MKKLISAMMILFCLFTFAGCKKDFSLPRVSYPPLSPLMVKLNPAGLEYVQLPAGRWFAYEDSSTGMIDTVSVSRSSIEIKFQKGIMGSSDPGCVMCYGSRDYYYEEYTLQLNQKNGLPWFKGIASWGGLGINYYYGADSVIILSELSMVNSTAGNYLSCFWYPFLSYGQALSYQFIPVMSFSGLTFYNVHAFASMNGLEPTDPYYYTQKFYWVKNIGIIKKEIKRYNSVQTSLLLSYW